MLERLGYALIAAPIVGVMAYAQEALWFQVWPWGSPLMWGAIMAAFAFVVTLFAPERSH